MFSVPYHAPYKLFHNKACQRRHFWRRGAKMRRARIAGAREIEAVDPRIVFARDGWRCQACRMKVLRKTKISHPRHPNADHIIALSAGGAHTYANMQTLCRACNLRKGARTAGAQLRLPLSGIA